LLDVREAGLALAADGHEAAGDANVYVMGFQFLCGLRRILVEDLRHRVRALVLIRIGLLAKSFDLLELLEPELVNILV
jgi:hypothetical protein